MSNPIEMNQKTGEKIADAFKKKITIKDVLLLQGVIIIYTLSSVTAKFASGQELFSLAFFMFYGLEVVILGIYAIAWQQIIKKFDLSVAYANRAMAILWSAVWAILLFHNHLTLKNAAGIVLVMIGTIVINSDQQTHSAISANENEDFDGREEA